MVAEGGADVCEGVDDGLAPVPVDSGQHIPAVPSTGEVLGWVDVVLRGGHRAGPSVQVVILYPVAAGASRSRAI